MKVAVVTGPQDPMARGILRGAVDSLRLLAMNQPFEPMTFDKPTPSGDLDQLASALQMMVDQLAAGRVLLIVAAEPS